MKLVLATGNAGKLDELRRLLAPLAIDVVSALELGLVLPEEDGDSYRANAAIKARAAMEATGLAALGDDTGLAIPSLGGAPGIATARFAAAHGGWAEACAELASRTGLFHGATVRATLCCALVLVEPAGTEETGESTIDGVLRWPPNDAPGLAAIFEPDPPQVLVDDGVLVHRRVAFERLLPALRRRAR